MVMKELVKDIAEQVLCRMDSKGETLEQAFEAVVGGRDCKLFKAVAKNLRGEK